MKTIFLFLVFGLAAAQKCSDTDISCENEEKCIPQNYICDGDNDCKDGSDEDVSLCQAWNNCNRGSVQCIIDNVASCVTIQEYCQQTAPLCSGSLDRRVCQIIFDKKLTAFDSIAFGPVNDPATVYNTSLTLGTEFDLNLNNTLSHPECPRLSTKVGDQCLSVFYVGSSSWGEARAFCKNLGGDLLTVSSIKHYAHVVSHLIKNQITSDFWIGGRYKAEDESWVWVDGKTMTMGTPFWALRRHDNCSPRNVTVPGSSPRSANNAECFRYRQAPESPPLGFCAALTYDKHFYMSDEDCLEKKSPLCVLTDV